MTATSPVYADRHHAGRVLAGLVAAHPLLAGRHRRVVVLGLPRGGVVVAAPVAAALQAPLDAVVVRKLGLPGRRELAMGAVAAVAGRLEVVWNPSVLAEAQVPDADLVAVLERELAELHRREQLYRSGRPAPVPAGAAVVLVDDGLATGASMRAALDGVRPQLPAAVVVAVPVGAPATCHAIAHQVDALICPVRPDPFGAVGQVYQDFSATSDEQVRSALAEPPDPAR